MSTLIERVQAAEASLEATEFDLAVGVVMSFYFEGADDSRLPELFGIVRETCPAAFDKILVLAYVLKEYPSKFDEFGAADAGQILRDFQPTADMEADAQRFLDAMHLEDQAAVERAKAEAAEYADPIRRATTRLLRKFKNPTLEQMLFELRRP